MTGGVAGLGHSEESGTGGRLESRWKEEAEGGGGTGGGRTEEETAPWNWFRSMDHWKQSSLLNSPPAHPADIKASFGMIYREARRAAL